MQIRYECQQDESFGHVQAKWVHDGKYICLFSKAQVWFQVLGGFSSCSKFSILPAFEASFQHLWGLTMGPLQAAPSIFMVLFLSCRFPACIFCLSHPASSRNLFSSEQCQGLPQGRSSSGHLSLLKANKENETVRWSFLCCLALVGLYSWGIRRLKCQSSLISCTGKETK